MMSPACHNLRGWIRTAHIMLRKGIRGLLLTNEHAFLVPWKQCGCCAVHRRWLRRVTWRTLKTE
jgi:hypothetical protein